MRRSHAAAILKAERQLTQTSSIVLKVGMVGDAQIGKTSLMVKYVEGSFEWVDTRQFP
jgi:GTP-binding protein of the ras superfamily involved in termination of M-phase